MVISIQNQGARQDQTVCHQVIVFDQLPTLWKLEKPKKEDQNYDSQEPFMTELAFDRSAGAIVVSGKVT